MSTVNYEAIASDRAAERPYTKLYWDIANEIGLSESALIQIIQSRCTTNARDQREYYRVEGNWWTSATYQEWAEKYPAMGSARTLQRLLLKLESHSFVVSRQPNAGRNNTKFYRVNEEAIASLVMNFSDSDPIVPDWCDDTDVYKASYQTGTTSVPKTDSEISEQPPVFQTEDFSVEVEEKLAPLVQVEPEVNIGLTEQNKTFGMRSLDKVAAPVTQVEVVTDPEKPVESLSKIAQSLTPLIRAEQYSSCNSLEERFNGYISNQVLDEYVKAWNSEKPSTAASATKFDSVLRSNLTKIARDYNVEEFKNSVVYAREQDKDYFRNQNFTLLRFTNQIAGHVSQCFSSHNHCIDNDPEYRARVEGRSRSKDLALVFDGILPEQLSMAQEFISLQERLEAIQKDKERRIALGTYVKVRAK